MSLEGLFVSIVLIILSIVVIAMPFQKSWRRNQFADLASRQLEELQVLYAQCIASIRDLDDDFKSGKLPENIYQQEREQWTKRGVLVLQTLHEFQQNHPIDTSIENPEVTIQGNNIDQMIELAVAKYKQSKV